MTITKRPEPMVAHRGESPRACDAPAQIHGIDGPITLGRCWLPQGHAGPHATAVDRVTWGAPDAKER